MYNRTAQKGNVVNIGNEYSFTSRSTYNRSFQGGEFFQEITCTSTDKAQAHKTKIVTLPTISHYNKYIQENI